MNTYKIVSKYFLSVVTKVSISQSSFLVVCPKLLSKFQTVNSVFLCFQQKNAFQWQHKTNIGEWNWLTCHFSLTQLPLQPEPTTPFSLSYKTTFLPATQTLCITEKKKASFLCRKLKRVCIVEFGSQKGYFLKCNGSVAGWCWWGYRLHVQDCDGWWLWGWKVSASESICEERVPHEIETHNWGGVSD